MGEADISTRTALVGGGATGIGHAAAAHLLRQGHGVVLTGRNNDTLQAAAEKLRAGCTGPVGTLVQDVAKLSDVDAAQAVQHVEERFGSLDVLVLNAGGPPPGRVLDVTDEQWLRSIELLLLGPLRLARAALPAMALRGFGRVVLVTSAMVRQPDPNLAISVVLRSAATAAAKLMSREYAANGVTVNCVAPGATATDRRTEVLAARAAASGSTLVEVAARDTMAVPAGRPATADEIGAAVAFLASRAASYVNGTVLTVDGGRTETI
ncbi:SDR family oxidoreductase [Kutzneria sp. CA-103260]|uniref:SDR family oxidoreductase n=1 Tax=Kutzneria sp. CA-103260 TaxID=2802641 RepID=UPI001BAC8BB6|nr:SDR family oxidoreductase [Kutzneria sp. CA-103260]